MVSAIEMFNVQVKVNRATWLPIQARSDDGKCLILKISVTCTGNISNTWSPDQKHELLNKY